jgi:CRISPR-associated protein Cmr5
MTRQQKWAKHAYDCARRVVDRKKKESEKKYATHCMKAPSLLRQAGLVQALAFLRTRSDEGKELVDDFAAALGRSSGQDLQARAHAASLPEYMQLTRDALVVATWFRRFAQAELEED